MNCFRSCFTTNTNTDLENITKDKDMENICYKNTVEFTFPIQCGKVVKVYDGDTITIAAKMPYIGGSPIYRFSVRLNGIDTPEIKGSSEDEKNLARMAREFVENMILHKWVRLENVKNEKYGRLLADVYIDDVHLNALLVEKRYAVAYDGGTKQIPASWTQYFVRGEKSKTKEPVMK
jgi:endonuclease YncB( thermonuclease family)